MINNLNGYLRSSRASPALSLSSLRGLMKARPARWACSGSFLAWNSSGNDLILACGTTSDYNITLIIINDYD